MIDITEFAEFVLADVKPIAELELTLLDAHGSVLAQGTPTSPGARQPDADEQE